MSPKTERENRPTRLPTLRARAQIATQIVRHPSLISTVIYTVIYITNTPDRGKITALFATIHYYLFVKQLAFSARHKDIAV
jgi:hypothetical protein